MKRILTVIVILALIGSSTLLYFLSANTESAKPIINVVDETTQMTDKSNKPNNYLDHIMSGGPPKDGIPPIDEPKYESVSESDYLNKYDKVFVFESLEGVFIYPQRILVWHEIVNDTIDGEKVAITYCPLTGSTICYLGDVNHPNNTYGTSGSLLNSNLVMYDRETDSYIPQILGRGINGDLTDVILPTKPIVWANWEDVKNKYPEAKVLSTETGYFRDYNNDPYGTYLPDDERSYYYFGGPLFPVMNESSLFSEKKIVVGVKADNNVTALDPFLVKKEGLIQFDIGSLKAVAVYDNELKAVRVFSREYNNTLLDFTATENGFKDQLDNNWSYNTTELTPLTYFDVMWFAWYAYYPNTEVIK